MAVVDRDFESWLHEKLTSLDIDSDVYGSYISGILSDEDDEESMKESLEGILCSFVEDTEELIGEIFEKWSRKLLNGNNDEESTDSNQKIEEIIAAHSAMRINEKTSFENTTSVADDNAAAKRALIAKYGEVFDEVDAETKEEKSAHSIAAITTGLFQNVNVESVVMAEKVKRDKQKDESLKKKDKDKLDREKQKVKKEDRKEKEKKRTQKQERRAR